MLLADVDRRHAQRRRLAQNVSGKMLGLVPAKRVGGEAIVGEGFRDVADGEMVCSQGEHAFPGFAPLPIRTLPDVGARRNRPGDRTPYSSR